MAAIKSYTDIEQSRKLAEILPLESADMCYKCIEDDPYDIICKPYSEWKEEYKGLLIRNDAKVIPAWSLAALMKIIEIDKSEICFDCYGEKYRVNVHYQTLGSFCQDNELYESKIDALFAMIEKFKNRNLL